MAEFISSHPAQEGDCLRKVAVAVDPSEGGHYAFHWCLDKICRPSDHLYILHVRPPGAATSTTPPAYIVHLDPYGALNEDGGVGDEQLELGSALERHNAEVSDLLLKRCRGMAAERKIPVEVVQSVGDARTELCHMLDEVGPDMLVIGSNGRGALKRLLLGSVSDYCAHHAPCPVLIVRQSTGGQDAHHAV